MEYDSIFEMIGLEDANPYMYAYLKIGTGDHIVMAGGFPGRFVVAKIDWLMEKAEILFDEPHTAMNEPFKIWERLANHEMLTNMAHAITQ